MRGAGAFFKKEFTELLRTKRLMILMLVFVFFGILNPATAKFTPKLLEMEAETMEAMGMSISEVHITALDSWAQFANNNSMLLIVALIMMSGTFTSEYSKGTLIPLLTKGLSRSSVVFTKSAVMLLMWSVGIWLCFGVTYFYSDFYWDNSVVSNIFFAAFGWWLFGVMLLSFIIFFSSFENTGIQVMLSTGAVYFVITLLGLFSKIKKYLPTYLCDSLSLYKGTLEPSDYNAAAVISAVISVAFISAAFPLTHKRQI